MEPEERAAARQRVLNWMSSVENENGPQRNEEYLNLMSAEPADLERIATIVAEGLHTAIATNQAASNDGIDLLTKVALTMFSLGMSLGVAQGWALTVDENRELVDLFADVRGTLENAAPAIQSELLHEQTLDALFRAIKARAEVPELSAEEVSALASSYWTLLDAMRPYWGGTDTQDPEA